MSARQSIGNAYTRSAILAWANTILNASHLTFQDIPCHDVALLLYGIFHSHHHQQHETAVAASANDTGAAAVPLLAPDALRLHDAQHGATCVRFLQLLQFSSVDTPHARTASPPPGTAPASTTDERSTTSAAAAVAQQRNAEHVLAMIRALSAEEAELLRTAPSNAISGPNGCGAASEESEEQRRAAAGTAANVVLLLGPSMTPTAWLSGSAFVEELKLWRWVRLMADRHRCTVASIGRAIADYLQHDGLGKGEAEALASTSPALKTTETQQQQQPQPRQRTPSQLRAEMSSIADDTVCEEGVPEPKRARPELSLSPAPALPTATTSSSSLLMPLHGSVSPVHALLSPIRDADRRAPAGHSTASAGAASAANWAVQDATEATATPYVTQARPLQQALQDAQVTLQQTLRDAHQTASAAATDAPTSPSTRSSTGVTATNTAVPPRPPALPAVVNVSDAQEASCRQRMTARVFHPTSAHENGAEGQLGGEGGASSPSLLAMHMSPPSCTVCPALMAHAIQCNLNAIDALEEVRAKAIAACMKKDAVALLAALQNVV